MTIHDKDIKIWIDQSNIHLKTAINLFNIHEHYACLFFCYLTLEKMLKGLILEHTNKQSPNITELKKLIKIANISLTREQILDFNEITTFNTLIKHNDVKNNFYKKGKAYTIKYLDKTKQYHIWLNKILPRKLENK